MRACVVCVRAQCRGGPSVHCAACCLDVFLLRGASRPRNVVVSYSTRRTARRAGGGQCMRAHVVRVRAQRNAVRHSCFVGGGGPRAPSSLGRAPLPRRNVRRAGGRAAGRAGELALPQPEPAGCLPAGGAARRTGAAGAAGAPRVRILLSDQALYLGGFHPRPHAAPPAVVHALPAGMGTRVGRAHPRPALGGRQPGPPRGPALLLT